MQFPPSIRPLETKKISEVETLYEKIIILQEYPKSIQTKSVQNEINFWRLFKEFEDRLESSIGGAGCKE
jgi:hypothetical protein